MSSSDILFSISSLRSVILLLVAPFVGRRTGEGCPSSDSSNRPVLPAWTGALTTVPPAPPLLPNKFESNHKGERFGRNRIGAGTPLLVPWDRQNQERLTRSLTPFPP